MANIRVKDLPNTDTLADADELIVDSSSAGTRRVSYSELKTEVAADYVAAPSTYKVATLASDNKLDPSQVPDTLSQGLNFVGNANSAGDLTSTTQGDFYVIQTAFGVYSVGDQAVYDGSSYVRVTDGTKQIGEGGTGATTLDAAKTALQIINVGTAANEVPTNGQLGNMSFQNSEAVTVDDLTVDGELTAAVGKPMPVNGPTMRFDGSNDYVSFADNDAFSFTNGTDDTPLSVSAWVKMEDATNFPVLSKYSTTTAAREWLFYVSGSDYLGAVLMGSDGNTASVISDEGITNREGQWTHLAMTYAGAGPNSSNSFSSASASGCLELYINGKLQPNVTRSSASYVGMQNTSQPVELARFNNATEAKGEIRDVKLFNKELSAAEVKEVYSNGQLGFAESTGAITYVSDFSADSLDGWTDGNGTADATSTVGGDSDNIQLTLDGSTSHHYLQKAGLGFIGGKTFKIEFDVFFPSSNSVVDELALRYSTTGSTFFYTGSLAKNTWVRFSTNVTWPTGSNITFRLNAADNGSLTGDDAAGESFALRNIRITQIGSVLDARAENYNQSAGKLLDVSGNDFVGTQSGGVELLTPRSHLSAGTLDLTNLPTSATGLSAGEVYNE